MLLMEELRFILDCFQFELARETMDKVLSFSLLDGKTVSLEEVLYVGENTYTELYLTDFLSSDLNPLFLEMRLFLFLLIFSTFLLTKNMTIIPKHPTLPPGLKPPLNLVSPSSGILYLRKYTHRIAVNK